MCDFRMEVESRIEVIGDGTVNLFVQNNFDVSFKAQINTNTKDPSRLAIGDNYFTVTLEDTYGNEYSREIYIPHYLLSEFHNDLAVNETVFNTSEIVVTGEIKTSWPFEFLILQLDGKIQPLDLSTEGVGKF